MVEDEELGKEIQALLHCFDPQGKVTTLLGYHYIASKCFNYSRIIDKPGSEFHGLPHAVAEIRALEKIKRKDFKDENDKEEIRAVLALEYKLHFMIKFEYILSFLEIFLNACKDDTSLTSLVSSIKIKQSFQPNAPELNPNKVLPVVVIYLPPKPEFANGLLEKLYRLFSVYDMQTPALGFPPRYSQAINPAFFYCQGGGDGKNAMTNSQEEFFLSQEKIHYKLPQQHLKNPAIQDLEFLSKLLKEAAFIEAFKCRKNSIVEHDRQCYCPHVRLWLHLSLESIEPPVLSQGAKAFIQRFYELILRPLQMPCPSVGLDENGIFLRLCLPNPTALIQSVHFKEEFLGNIYKYFAEPFEKFLLEDLEESADELLDDDEEMADAILDEDECLDMDLGEDLDTKNAADKTDNLKREDSRTPTLLLQAFQAEKELSPAKGDSAEIEPPPLKRSDAVVGRVRFL